MLYIIIDCAANKTSTGVAKTNSIAHGPIRPIFRVCNGVRVTSVDIIIHKYVMFQDLSNFARCNKDLNFHQCGCVNAL